ncbi:PAS domain-containing protein [Methylobacterium durans]|uniref:PAS domain-containing protein n=1 Tax=Methylobacterium durans TaxID=2202825 RepID=UPI002AFE107C|nr:PAS domain-containing protein [Methylobacterium durans]MEA1833655.1 PAS domain-containing protein [Methylobacterium durans]
MTAETIAFSSRRYLQLIESFGLIGTWAWDFATNAHAWSDGFCHLLGLEPGSVAPGYEQFRGFVHPDDRVRVQSASEILQGGTAESCRVRIVRPNREIRSLSLANEVYVHPDGRPRAAAGVALDVTDEDVAARIQATERRQRRAIFEETKFIAYSNSPDFEFRYPAEMFALTGLTFAETSEDPFIAVVPEEREHWRERSIGFQTAGLVHSSTPLVPLAEGGRLRLRTLSVPVRNADGLIVDWSSIAYPAHEMAEGLSGNALKGLEQALTGRHLRAARALLDWSMMTLARASGLSFATIRRLEADLPSTRANALHVAVAALRRAGIRFRVLDDSTICVHRT